MKKFLAFLMLAAMMLSVCTASAETLPIDGKVVSIQSYPIISQANGMIEQINFSVGDAVQANDCIATIATTKVYAPVAGTVYIWGNVGDRIDDVATEYGAVAYIEPENPYTITTSPVDSNGRAVTVHLGQKVYLICVTDGKKTGEGVITSASASEYTVRVENNIFDASDMVSIYTTPDHKASNWIGRGYLKRIDNVSCAGTGYIINTHVQSGDRVKKGDLLYETLEGRFSPEGNQLNQILAPQNGVIEEMNLRLFQETNELAIAAVIYPDSSLRVQALIPEFVLKDYQVGDTVYIIAQSSDGNQRPVTGVIEKISRIPEVTESRYDVCYAAFIKVSDRSELYYGMNVTVTKQNPMTDQEQNPLADQEQIPLTDEE